MFLHRISLSPEAPGDPVLAQTVENPYRLHQEVWALFADGPGRRRDFLYRFDQTGWQPRIFCLSEREPRRSRGFFRVESKPFSPALKVGERLRFSLRANPVVSRNGGRHDVVMDAKRELKLRGVPRHLRPTALEIAQERGTAWLLGRAARHGFAADPAAVRVERYKVLEFAKPDGTKVRLGTCDFTGLLEVTDLAAFLTTLGQGIGPAKGFGCGLLLCKRAS